MASCSTARMLTGRLSWARFAPSTTPWGAWGIVPNIGDVNVVSYNGSTRADAIIAAIGNMVFGDVLLLEAQVTVDEANLLGPIEAYDAEFDAIRLTTALGMIVVEAGGNGTNNGSAPPLAMDTFTDPMV
jgi:serine protease